MANIKIVVNGPLMDGHKLTFKAPCDCISVEKLKVCYVENATQKNRLFTMKDAHGNDLTGLGNLFSQGAYVDVVLDTVNGFAYLQNAGTNKYLEQKITPVDNLESDRSDLPLSARMGSELNKKLVNENSESFNFGVKDGVRGFFTNPSRADDSFVPFSSGKVIPVTVSGKTNFNSAWTINLGVKINSFMWWSDAKAGVSYVTMGACLQNLKKLHSSSRNETVDFNYSISGTTVTFPQQPIDTFKNGATIYFIVV